MRNRPLGLSYYHQIWGDPPDAPHLQRGLLASQRAMALGAKTAREQDYIHAIAWWGGFRFDDLLRTYRPRSQAKMGPNRLIGQSRPWGNPDRYFVSLDLSTARRPQTLLAAHLSGKPLTVEHGAPLRLVVPVKLGLKNIEAITRITYTKDEPADYWAKLGYSRYDGS